MIKPAKGTRQCNCKNKVVTRQVGPGMYQQYQSQECEQCSNVKLARDSQTLHVTIDAGTPEKHVSLLPVSYGPCLVQVSSTRARSASSAPT